MLNKRDREFKVVAVIALLIAVVGLSVAYAALSTTLKITGSATVNSATWQVKFVEGGTWENFGDASATGPTYGVTTLSNIVVTLVKPGDKAVYEFKVANTGTLPAKLSSSTIGTLSCTGGTNQDEANATCANLSYTLVYKDTGVAPSEGDTLAKGSSRDLLLTVEFKDTASTVPASAVTVSGITATLEYVQE